MEIVLSADIGGTTTRLRLFSVPITEEFKSLDLTACNELPGDLLFDEKYFNDKYESLVEVIQLFLRDAATSSSDPLVPSTACLAVAGPVTNNRAKLTNRSSWVIDGDLIAAEIGIKHNRVINDFLAMGYGILTLKEETECVVLQSAPKDMNAPIACIGAGTGLGECFLTPDRNGVYECYPSEGGHAEFAPRNDEEIQLLKYLSKKFCAKHRISVERLVSGTGLANIYEFLSQEYPDQVTSSVHSQINAVSESDRGRVISIHASICSLCRRTMLIFTTAYGSEAGVAGLKWLPYGGLYLTGGLTPKNIGYITGTEPGSEGLFMRALLDKGRVSGMLHSIPIYAVMVENLGERGAYYTALRLLQHEVNSKHQINDSIIISSSTASTTATSSSSHDSISDVNLSSIMLASTVVTVCLTVGMYYLYLRGKK